MATNALYPKAREKFLRGEIDWDDHNIKVSGVDATYTYDAAHEFHTSLTGIVFTSADLTGKTSIDGIADAADLTVPAVSGATIAGLIVWRDTATPATSPLILYLARTAASVVLAVAPDGGDLRINWPNGATKIFKL